MMIMRGCCVGLFLDNGLALSAGAVLKPKLRFKSKPSKSLNLTKTSNIMAFASKKEQNFRFITLPALAPTAALWGVKLHLRFLLYHLLLLILVILFQCLSL